MNTANSVAFGWAIFGAVGIGAWLYVRSDFVKKRDIKVAAMQEETKKKRRRKEKTKENAGTSKKRRTKEDGSFKTTEGRIIGFISYIN